MSVVAAAGSALRSEVDGVPVILETADGPRFPHGVVPLGSGRPGSPVDPSAVSLPLTAHRWWDSRCRVRSVDRRRVQSFVTGLDPLPLPGPAASCIGWGPGLTPAGDDVIVGMLIGFHACGLSDRARTLAESCADADTVPFSRVLLDYAADGHAVRPLLDLVAALAGHGNLDCTIEVLNRFGATSGRHIVEGVRRAVVAAADTELLDPFT